MKTTQNHDTLLNKIFAFFLFGLALSLFVSKSGLSVFFTLALLTTLFAKPLKHELIAQLKKHKILGLILLIWPLFLLSNLFSSGGLTAVKNGFLQWPYALAFLPLIISLNEPLRKKALKLGLILGLIIACCYSFYKVLNLGHSFDFTLDRVQSFWDIGRWGTFTAVSCIFLYPFILNIRPTKLPLRLFYLFLFILSYMSLVFTNTRAPLLFSVGLIIALSFFHLKKIKYILFIFLAIVLSLFLFPQVKDRVLLSIAAKTDTQTGAVVAKDRSTTGRLYMWHVGLDFWKENKFNPTGFEFYQTPIRQFLQTRDQAYLDKYTTVEFSYNDNHSSYLFFLIQVGLFFSLYFWGVIAFLILKNIKKLFFYKEEHRPLLLASYFVVFFHLILGAVYSSLASFEAITFFPALALICTIGDPSYTKPEQTSQNAL